MLIVKFYILENEKKMLLFIQIHRNLKVLYSWDWKNVIINNFFNIEKKKKKFFKKFVKKLWLVLKLNVFFIISKKLKIK